MNELEKAIEQRLNDETWDLRMAATVTGKFRIRTGARLASAAAALLFISITLGIYFWQQPEYTNSTNSEEAVPFVFADEIVLDDGDLDLMASGLIFE
ncbi:MAG TPA: hypothetical protein DEA96_15805 [Leptospiraceae bacterium]|nr:hypothetical protein [Spirochaetaceae bacterium]HBS06433.1 hypothetical protein [Leptospiraceae bacterium]|tara:strand:- start:12409 stop:12699 length:291 start_codon:yes stop_codon:yes gene_type:complete